MPGTKKNRYLATPENHELMQETLRLYRDKDPDFAALLEFLYEHRGITESNEKDENLKALVIAMSKCFDAILDADGKDLTLDQIKEALDSYMLDESQFDDEKQRFAKFELESDDTGPATGLFLSQMRGFKDIIKKHNDAHDDSFNCIFSLQCLHDSIRTRNFLKAIKQRINQIESTSQEAINVIDAGCGSIPIMGIYAALCSDKVKVTCIEFDSSSYIFASQLVHDIGLDDRVEVLFESALEFQPSKGGDAIHLIISETMNHGFYTEHMTYIMNHLKQFADPNTFFIPQKVELGLVFKSCPEPRSLEKIDFAGFFNDAEHVESWFYTPGAKTKIDFDLKLNEAGVNESGYFAINTKVELADDIKLNPGESLISLTRSLPDYFKHDSASKASVLKLSYDSGAFDETNEFSITSL